MRLRLFGLLALLGLTLPVVDVALAGDYVIVPHPRTAGAVRQFTGGFDFFPSASGTYNGLIAPEGELAAERSGYFRIKISSYGSYSGKFTVGGDTVPLRGFFDSGGLAGVSIYRWVWDDCDCFRYLLLVWTVELDLIADSDEIEGTVVNERHGGWLSSLYGLRAEYASFGGAPQAGRYTMRLPGSVDASVAPPGDGYGAVKVDSRGQVQMNGALPDGVKMSDSAYLSVDGYWPLYVPMSDGHGILLGWLQFTGGQLSGELTWVKPARLDRIYYPEGFSGSVTVTGGTYLIPSGSTSPFTWVDGRLQLSDGNLGGLLANDVLFTSPKKLLNEGGDIMGLKSKLNARTGVFTGSFLHPVSGRRTSCAGAMFQFEDAGGGYFLGLDQGGTVQLIQ